MPEPLRHRWLLILLGLFAALCLPILLHDAESNYTWDESNYYLPAIRQMNETWPRLDLIRDSLSATSPGYTYLLAGISRLIGPERGPMRAVNFAVSVGVLLVLWFMWPGSTPEPLRFAAVLPLAGSNFFVKSSSFVVTDNAALLAIVLTLGLVLLGGRPAAPVVASATAALAVFFRQINLWLAAPLLLRSVLERRPLGWLLLLPSVGMMAWLFHGWGGLVPPLWRQTHVSGLATSAAAYQLALLAGFGPFFYAAVRPAWRDEFRDRWAGAGAAAGLLIALAGPCNPSWAAGRWGGYLWNVAGFLPVIGDRSLFFLAGASAGGAMLAVLTRHLWLKTGAARATGWLAAVMAFMATGLVNRQVFQRYYEPTLLVLLLFWVIMALGPGPVQRRPLLLLGALQVLLTLLTAHARTFGLLH